MYTWCTIVPRPRSMPSYFFFLIWPSWPLQHKANDAVDTGCQWSMTWPLNSDLATDKWPPTPRGRNKSRMPTPNISLQNWRHHWRAKWENNSCVRKRKHRPPCVSVSSVCWMRAVYCADSVHTPVKPRSWPHLFRMPDHNTHKTSSTTSSSSH